MNVIKHLTELGYSDSHFSEDDLAAIQEAARRFIAAGSSPLEAVRTAISTVCPSRGLAGAVGSFAAGEPQPDEGAFGGSPVPATLPHPPTAVIDVSDHRGESPEDQVVGILIRTRDFTDNNLSLLRRTFNLNEAEMASAVKRALQELEKAPVERPTTAPPMPKFDGRDPVEQVAEILAEQPQAGDGAVAALGTVYGLTAEQLAEARRRALVRLQKVEPARMRAERSKEELAAFGAYLDALIAKAEESKDPEDLRRAMEARDRIAAHYKIDK